ncbi:MAG TPA: AAA family ATPase [Methanobacterium sp.]|nr:AAA family ATPase [Methanobacterium sp.]
METVLEFKKTISNLLKARFPCLYIPSWEEDRLLTIINDIARDSSLIKTKRNVFTWKITTGFVNIEHDTIKTLSGTKDPLKALEFIEKYNEPAVFLMFDLHSYFGSGSSTPNFQVIRKIRDVSSVLKRSPNPKNIIFVSPSLDIPLDLQKDISIVEFDLPSFEELMKLLEDMIAVNKEGGRINIDLNEEEKERIAKAAVGLTIQEAENAFARAMVEGGNFDINKLDLILEEKSQIIKKTEILEVIRSDLDMKDVGGLGNIKNWLEKRNKSWMDSAKLYGISAPNGLLITGVPGCGKSLIVKAISSIWQLPLLRLDIGKVFSGIVGSSEENMRKALKIAEATSPSILWIDEIEKGFNDSDGDSGTSSRVFGTFLTWMQEKTKPVFVAATANNIGSLPPEFLRKGRFDEIFFVDIPTYKERMDIFRIHLQRRLLNPEVIGEFKITEDVLRKLSDMTEGYVGAEIEQVVISALFEAFSESRSISFDDLEKAIKGTVPLSVTQAEQIRFLRDWANLRAVAATSNEDRADYESLTSGSTEDEEKYGIDDDIGSVRGGRAIDF